MILYGLNLCQHNFIIMRKYILFALLISLTISVTAQKRVQIITDGTEKVVFDSTGHILIKNTGSSVFLGDGAGRHDNLNSNFNTFIGQNAGQQTINGFNNVALGYAALRYNVTGFRNTIIGRRAMENDTSGDYNVVVGDVALLSNKNGSRNTALGASAGLSNKGSGNVFLGFEAGYNEIGDNKLYIDNSSTASPLIYGEFNNNLLRVNGTLAMSNAYTFPSTAGVNGQVLKYNAGAASWQSDNVDDADADPANEIQTLTYLNNNLSLSDANSVNIPAGKWSQGGDEIYYNSAGENVAIGTSNSAGKLHIRQSSSADGIVLDHVYSGSASIRGLDITMPSSASGPKSGILVQSVGGSSTSNTGINSYVIAGANGSHQAIYGQVSGAATAIRGSALDAAGKAADFTGLSEFHGRSFFDGDVGIGTENPLSNFHILSESSFAEMFITPDTNQFNGDSRIFMAEDDDATYGMYWHYDGGDNQMELWGKAGMSIYGPHLEVGRSSGRIYLKDSTIVFDPDVSGNGRVITDEIEIRGGSDLAEYFNSGNIDVSTFEPGTVVRVSDVDGEIAPSDVVHDKRVIGIVSGAQGVKTGMYLGQKGTLASGHIPVAIAGRVYVKVTHENGPIEPGDFLTTSSSSGQAMKVIDFDLSRGSILGKALTHQKDGYVLVLIGLQ